MCISLEPVKAWGDSRDEAVILLHGLLDNAGSFDTLIPLLPSNFYYLCVDLPGHGLSSNFPPNLPIHFVDFLYAVKIVMTHFKRKTYAFISHSFGGRISTLFTQLYPHLVSNIAILDVGYVSITPPGQYVAGVIRGFDILDKTLSFEPQRSPSYTYEEAVNKVMKNRMLGELTYSTAEHLAKRMTKKVGDDRYKFTFDQRLRGMITPSFSNEFIKEMFKKYPLTCPAICIYASSTKKIAKRQVLGNLRVPGFKYYEIKGHHHSHHTNPELFAPILSRFLEKRKPKL
ncbi:hypothetical protein Trydic_g22411 [Trypoxylus dichotomus]